MNIDRELHELAAKAAGYDVFWHHANQCYMIVEGNSESKWEPLDNDGDAFRLMIDCNLTICADGLSTISAWQHKNKANVFVSLTINKHLDKKSAARLVIVRAAIGNIKTNEPKFLVNTEIDNLRTRNWTRKMSDAWHRALPNLEKAFDDLISEYKKGVTK